MKKVAAMSGRSFIFRPLRLGLKGMTLNLPTRVDPTKGKIGACRGHAAFRYNPTQTRRDGRVAEGGGLLNRYRVKSSIGGSNPPLSAILSISIIIFSRLASETESTYVNSPNVDTR